MLAEADSSSAICDAMTEASEREASTLTREASAADAAADADDCAGAVAVGAGGGLGFEVVEGMGAVVEPPPQPAENSTTPTATMSGRTSKVDLPLREEDQQEQ